MEQESDGDTKCNRHARYSHQRIATETGELGNKRTSGDHPNNRIVEISQNFGDLKRPGCHSDSNGKPSAHAGVKNSQMYKVIIIIITIENS